jgi:predicted DNA-binding transcriptional regulator
VNDHLSCIQSINTESRFAYFNMARDKIIGAALLIGSIIGIIIYFSLMFLAGSVVSTLLLEITAFVAVLAVLAILGWIGYVMATTPPPVPLEQETPPTTEPPKPAETK